MSNARGTSEGVVGKIRKPHVLVAVLLDVRPPSPCERRRLRKQAIPLGQNVAVPLLSLLERPARAGAARHRRPGSCRIRPRSSWHGSWPRTRTAPFQPQGGYKTDLLLKTLVIRYGNVGSVSEKSGEKSYGEPAFLDRASRYRGCIRSRWTHDFGEAFSPILRSVQVNVFHPLGNDGNACLDLNKVV